VYACLQRAGDALFEVADALLTDPSAQSLAELSLAPSFQRRWPSLYAAFADGRIDQQALGEVFARYLPLPADGERLWLGIDGSPIQRPESKTARDRSFRQWCSCHSQRAVGPMSWIKRVLPATRALSKWPPPNCDGSCRTCPAVPS
jgi:hypothetical protein